MELTLLLLAILGFHSFIITALFTTPSVEHQTSPLIVRSTNQTLNRTLRTNSLALNYPRLPYCVPISGEDATLCIYYVIESTDESGVKVSELCRFIDAFVESILQEYPITGFVPRVASDWVVDISSYRYV